MEYEEMFLWMVIILTWLEYLWELYLSLRQHKVYKRSKDVPKELEEAISAELFEKSRLYALDKSYFALFRDTYVLILSSLMIKWLYIYHCWEASGEVLDYLSMERGELKQTAVFVIILQTISTIMATPFNVYETFILEEKHGFNKQTGWFFVKDKIKSYFLLILFVAPLTCAASYIVKIGGDFFFLYLWLFTMGTVLFFMTIYPEYIAPLFDKYTPLPDGKLKMAIENLAASINFPLSKLYLVEGSKRSAHSNAYFYGFFGNKRIVLFDTLIQGYSSQEKEKDSDSPPSSPQNKPGGSGDGVDAEKEVKGCSDDEVVAVLAHELGHWHHNHVGKNILIMQINLLVQFSAFALLFKYPILYRAFGFTDEKPVVVGFIIILMYVFSVYNCFLGLAMVALSRYHEFQADRFAIGLNKAELLKSALIKLHKDNLSFPVYDWLYSMQHHSHPTLLQRLAALNQKTK